MSNRITRSKSVKSFVTAAGSQIHVLYEPRFNGQRLSLFEIGSENIQAKIESFAPFTDINYMLNRLKIGDHAVLNSRQPMYGDFTVMPNNPIDAINMVHSAEAAFGALSNEERKNYNNDYRVWLANIVSSAVNASPGSHNVSPAVPVPDPVVSKEVSE